ncbi:hypothetical protein B0H66DRAFT_574469 [Apodospora peruviana]|uniref:Ribosomal protein s17 n=1 Tax=Apodospora peruviana TaxID=516989 RepID=A0AAE0M7T4_9PEZI|nr:hypothetical protein B0H66DRAFT_574469 [Apodospora peruviana]
MSIRRLLSASLLFTLVLAQANDGNGNGNGNGGNGGTTLDPDVIQEGSFVDGLDSLGAEAVQAASQTSQNNFINFCKGQTLTNGLQNTEGSCNGIGKLSFSARLMGQIPAKNNMVSTVILSPQNGDDIQGGTDFDITLQVSNLVAGSFTNAVAAYYSAPQTLQDGLIVGHTHVTIQDMGNNQQPPDPTLFSFFKGINDNGNGQGTLNTTVTGGLAAGNYRLCTLTSAANHQPVIMPVAQRGAQDDCVRFTVSGGGNVVNDAANNGKKGQAAAELAASAVQLGPGAPTGAADANAGQAGDAGGGANANGGQGADAGGQAGNGNADEGAGQAGNAGNAGGQAGNGDAGQGANGGAGQGGNGGQGANGGSGQGGSGNGGQGADEGAGQAGNAGNAGNGGQAGNGDAGQGADGGAAGAANGTAVAGSAGAANGAGNQAAFRRDVNRFPRLSRRRFVS